MTAADAADIIGLYQRKASDWIESRARTRLIEKRWLDRFRALLPPGATVLDIGCGAARPMAAYLIEAGHPVVGVDSSPAMIDACRRHFPAQEWIVGDMRTLALQRKFSGMLAWDSFFHLCYDDQRNMFPVFRAHAAPERGADVHQRSRAWGGDRRVRRRAAVSREPRCGGISLLARSERVSRGGACRRGPRLRRPHRLAGAARLRRSGKPGRRTRWPPAAPCGYDPLRRRPGSNSSNGRRLPRRRGGGCMSSQRRSSADPAAGRIPHPARSRSAGLPRVGSRDRGPAWRRACGLDDHRGR